MNNLATVQPKSVTPVVRDDELMTVLRNSLYPGAANESIKLVLGYCKAAGLDPMQKPVHIVPMWDSKSQQMRDVIMPGVGLYRTQAARSGQLAGISEPEFGPDVTENIGGVTVTYPSWCKVTVKRALENGTIAEFTAVERWKENYAVKGGKEKSVAPNAMWMRRPYAQLAKCSQAQALRIAFPEMIGAQPTAEEMEGKEITEDAPIAERVAPEPKPLPPYPDESMAKNMSAWEKLIADGKQTSSSILAMIASKYTLSPAQRASIEALTPKQDEPDLSKPPF